MKYKLLPKRASVKTNPSYFFRIEGIDLFHIIASPEYQPSRPSKPYSDSIYFVSVKLEFFGWSDKKSKIKIMRISNPDTMIETIEKAINSPSFEFEQKIIRHLFTA